MYVCMHIGIPFFRQTYMGICVYVSTYIFYRNKYVHTHLYVCVYLYAYIHMYAGIFEIYVYIYMSHRGGL